MNKIVEKINNHKVLSNSNVIKFIEINLKELGLFNEHNNIFFTESTEYMCFLDADNSININPNYKNNIINNILEEELVKVRTNANSSTFLKDSINLTILWHILHEIRHYEQSAIFFKEKGKYNNLLKASDNYLIENNKYYIKKHPLYLIEHDAYINSMLKTFKLIEKLNISENAIYYFNVLIAEYLLVSRGYMISDNKLIKSTKFSSPFEFLYFLNRVYDKDNKTIKKDMIDLRMKCNNEYDKLIIGDNISYETINKIILILEGKIKTKNIFEEIIKQEKVKTLKKEIK